MKNLFLFLFLAALIPVSYSQSATPPFKQNKNLPAFELKQTDNSVFSSSKLKKGVPVIIMFFSPSCDHCIHQFEEMMQRKNDLKNYQVVMPTIQPAEELAAFEKKYQLAKHPNYKTGIDHKYFFPTFFQIQNFPYLAFYDKNGKLISTFEGNLSVDKMLKNYK